MPLFRVRFEASAAVGVEIEVTADDAGAANIAALAMLLDRRETDRFETAVYELMVPHPEAVIGYAEATGLELLRLSAELDESGFELTEVEPSE